MPHLWKLREIDFSDGTHISVLRAYVLNAAPETESGVFRDGPLCGA